MKHWKSAAFLAAALLLTIGLGTPYAQQATRVVLLLGSSVVSATNPLPVTSGGITPGPAAFSSASISFNSSGDNTVITRSVGTIKVYGLVMSCASALTTLTMKNGAGTTLGPLSNVTSVFLPLITTPYYSTTSTNNFVINLSSGVQCGGTVYYIDS